MRCNRDNSHIQAAFRVAGVCPEAKVELEKVAKTGGGRCTVHSATLAGMGVGLEPGNREACWVL